MAGTQSFGRMDVCDSRVVLPSEGRCFFQLKVFLFGARLEPTSRRVNDANPPADREPVIPK